MLPHTLDQILPSLASFGVLAYWIIGLASTLESWFVTGLFVPGTLIVDAGGIMVQQGALDFFDLVWFVAIGSVLGAEVGFLTGWLARRGLASRNRFIGSDAYARAERLFARHRGKALVVGRFLGPLAGLVPLVAAVAGMDRRRFLLWNIAAAIPYAFAHVALGYFLGDLFTKFGPLFTRIALAAMAIAVALAVLWWLVLRIIRLMPFLASVGRSIGQAIVEHPDVAAWIRRHPVMAAQLGSRFDKSRFSGRTLTFLALAFLYVLLIWAGSVFDFLTAGPILGIDDRVANLVHAFGNPGLLRVAAHLSALGDLRVVAALFVAIAGWLLLAGCRDLAAGLGAAFAGNLISVALLQAVFHRPRPALAYFAQSTNSFPSGPAAMSVAFWGMAFYAAWRLHRLGLVTASLLAATLAFSVGASQIYLLDHFMSDVVNGWLVGGLWLLIGIAVAELLGENPAWQGQRAFQGAGKLAAALGCAALIGYAGWTVAMHEKARNAPAQLAAEIQAPDLATAIAAPDFHGTTESVLGNPLEPVNVVLLAPSDAALKQAMAGAGWTAALAPSPGTLTKAAWAAWTNQPDTTAPVTPYFWAGQPNDFAFEKPTPDASVRKRHHLRVWRTRYVLASGQRVFVGAASYDDGLDPGIFHHIAPNVGAERDTLAADLKRAGASILAPARLSDPGLGQSVAGDPWFSDGRAAVIDISAIPE